MDARPNVLRGAIVGFGQVAEHAHVPALGPESGLEIVAVAEADAGRQAAAKAALPGARVYPSLAALLAAERDLDFVDIATPPFAHAEQVLSALKAGLHVLCEKPLTLDLAALEAIEAAAKAAGRTVYTVDNWKHSPLFSKLFALVDGGAVGPVRRVELKTLRKTPAPTAVLGWRTDPKKSGGGILVDHGWHSLYLIRRLAGEQACRSAARKTPLDPSGAERELVAELGFSSARAVLHLSWLSEVRRNEGVVVGEKGEIGIEDDALIVSKGKSDRPQRFEFGEKLSQGSAHPDWFKVMLDDFKAEAAGRGRGRNLAQARFCAETIAALYRPDAEAAAR